MDKELYKRHIESSEKNRKKKRQFPDFWLCRGYKQERADFLAYCYLTNTLSERDLQLTKCETCWKADFWISRGYTEDEAVNKVKEVQSRNNDKVKQKYSAEERKKFSTTTLQYYLSKGYTLEEAKKLRAERQDTFTLKKCISKYGKEEGERIYKSRQEKWQSTLKSKGDKELARINSLKGINLDRMIEKYGREEGTKRYEDWYSKVSMNFKNLQKYSKESIEWFSSFIPEEVMQQADFGDNELYIFDEELSRVYLYDFHFKGVIVEYHGEKFHFNERVEQSKETWKPAFKTNVDESIEKDRRKRSIAINKGYKFFEVFSNDSEEYKSKIKSDILGALNLEKDKNQTVQSSQVV